MSGSCLPDITVVFEATYQTFHENGCENAITNLKLDRGRLACLMHSVPDSLMTTYSDVAAEIQKLNPFVATFFITNQTTALYTSLGDHWEQFVQAISL